MDGNADIEARLARLESALQALQARDADLAATLAGLRDDLARLRAGRLPAPPEPAPTRDLASAAEPPVAAPEATTALPAAEAAPAPDAARPLPPPLPPRPAPTPPAFLLHFDILGSGEFWFKFLGIGLLLLGLAFFFKYSIDRGWLTEPVRVILGLILGTVLLGFGLAFRRSRRAYSQVLLGGSMAAYYVTGFAAWTLFHLVDYPWASGFMSGVTLLAFVLAVSQDTSVLALVGVAGGLLTPFVLPTDTHSIPGLVGYTCVVLTGAVGITFFRGWRGLLWLSYAGGWAVLTLGWLAGTSTYPVTLSLADRWALQAGAVFMLLAFWGLSVLRALLVARAPERWAVPVIPAMPDLDALLRRQVHVLTISAPLLTLGFSHLVWADLVTTEQWGWITLGPAALYALVAWALRGRLPALAYTHAMMDILLELWALVQILQGDALIFALAAEATALVYLARWLGDRGTAVAGHLLWLGTGWWLLLRLLFDLVAFDPGAAGWAAAATDLAVIALLAATSFAAASRHTADWYRLGVHVVFVLWLAVQLHSLPEGWGLTVLAWTAYAALLILLYRLYPADFPLLQTMVPAPLILLAALGIFAARAAGAQAGTLALLNGRALIDATFLAALAALGFLVLPRETRPLYWLGALVGLLGLLWRELAPLENGQAYITIAWGLVGLILLGAGLGAGRRMPLIYAGIGTLLLVVAKLFLVDLTALDPLWRVLLFMGFGGVFLVLSYYFQNVIGGAGPADRPRTGWFRWAGRRD